jgi:hypothetical protein
VTRTTAALAAPSAAAEATPCPVARDGRPLQRVVVGSKATDRTRAAAKTLTAQLGFVATSFMSGNGTLGWFMRR